LTYIEDNSKWIFDEQIAEESADLAGMSIVFHKKNVMPEKNTTRKAQRDRRQGKSPSTQAGEFVHEEIKNIRKGNHGARNAKQAIAIGLSKARRAGVNLKPPKEGTTSEKTRRSAESAYRKGQRHEPVSRTRSHSREEALRREPTSSASHTALSRQAHSAAMEHTAAERSASAKRASETKGPRERPNAAKKAARTRAKQKR